MGDLNTNNLMKNIEQVKKEIAELQKEGEELRGTKMYKRIEKKVGALYKCQLYLESNPTQEFIEKQKADLKKRLKIIAAGLSVWLRENPQEGNSTKNPKSKYNTLMGVKTIKQQLATLEYLLS